MPPKKQPPGPVPVEALEYFREKGLKVGFDFTDVWKAEHSAAFTVAKVAETDVLKSVRQFAERALVEGVEFKEFQAQVQPLLNKSGWASYNTEKPVASRVKLIFDTNMRVARAAGQWQRIDRTKETLPYLEYGIGPSSRHRETHVDWDGTILPADDEWWDAHFVPNGYG